MLIVFVEYERIKETVNNKTFAPRVKPATSDKVCAIHTEWDGSATEQIFVPLQKFSYERRLLEVFNLHIRFITLLGLVRRPKAKVVTEQLHD